LVRPAGRICSCEKGGYRERVGLHEDFGPCPVYFLDDGRRRSPVRREIDLDGGIVKDELVGVGTAKAQKEER